MSDRFTQIVLEEALHNLENEVLSLRNLKEQMVGTLYPSIVEGKIWDLTDKIREIKYQLREEDEDGIGTTNCSEEEGRG